MRVIAYLRTSTDKQDVSVEAQESNIRAYCKIKGLEIADGDVIADVDEFSGTLDRPGMQQILRLVETRKIDAVAIYRLDRMTRSVRDAVALVDLFNKHGVTFISVMESLDTKTPMGMFFVQMIAAIAELERRTICERTKTALQHIKKSGCPAGAALYGWTAQERPRDAAGKPTARMPLIPNVAEQHTIKVARQMRNDGISYRDMARELNEAGYRTRKGGKWHFTAMAGLISAQVAE